MQVLTLVAMEAFLLPFAFKMLPEFALQIKHQYAPFPVVGLLQSNWKAPATLEAEDVRDEKA